ncbi:MAG TPA: carboxylesterase family protein [Mycobacteriales bacterium]
MLALMCAAARSPIVSTRAGDLRGHDDGGVLSYLGVPYAAPPVGELRFAAPGPVQPWDGVRDATTYGPTAPKGPYPPGVDALLPEPVIEGEDCLNLNVWTPDPGGRRPVLVWIHGGAFVNGSGAVTAYDGSRFARDGVVCVTINYRLGAEGFLLLDGRPPNRGLLDQVAALTWVRDNIAAFGGDPDAVTIAGESAGAMSVTTLTAMPAARGLFRRVIAQSGGGHHAMSATTAAAVTTALAADLDVTPTAEGFAGVPVDRLVEAQTALSARIATQPDPALWGEIVGDSMAFEPCVDGTVLPSRPIDAMPASTSDIDMLVGSNADEATLFLVPNGLIDFVTDDLLQMSVAGFGLDPAAAVAAYRAALPEASPGELLAAVIRDRTFRIPAVRMAESRLTSDLPTYVYEFAWPSPQWDGRLGATHALEIGFVFDTLDDPSGEPFVGPKPPQHVADVMHAAWVAFVTDGDPGWAPYGSDRTVMRFDDTSAVVRDPAPELRQVWTGVR